MTVKLLDNKRFVENIGLPEYIEDNGIVNIICQTIEDRDNLDLENISLYKQVFVVEPYPGVTYRLMSKDPLVWREESSGGGSGGGLTSADVEQIIDNRNFITETEVDNKVIVLNNLININTTNIENNTSLINTKVDKNILDNKLYGRKNDSWTEIIISEVDLSNYYNKPDTDTLLLTKANIDDIYNKSDIDNKLNLKANLDDIYNKSDTEALLLTKANTDSVYNKIDTDTKLNLKENIIDVDTKLSLKSDILSPTFTGTPAAPTAPIGTNTTQLANTSFVINEIDDAFNTRIVYGTGEPPDDLTEGIIYLQIES